MPKPKILTSHSKWILYQCFLDATICKQVVELVDNSLFEGHSLEQQVHEAIVNTYEIGVKANLCKVMDYFREYKLDVTAYQLCTLANNPDLFHWSGLCDEHNNLILSKLIN